MGGCSGKAKKANVYEKSGSKVIRVESRPSDTNTEPKELSVKTTKSIEGSPLKSRSDHVFSTDRFSKSKQLEDSSEGEDITRKIKEQILALQMKFEQELRNSDAHQKQLENEIGRVRSQLEERNEQYQQLSVSVLNLMATLKVMETEKQVLEEYIRSTNEIAEQFNRLDTKVKSEPLESVHTEQLELALENCRTWFRFAEGNVNLCMKMICTR